MEKIAEYLRLEKWKRLKMKRLFGFLIPDLRLEMMLDRGRHGAVMLVPVALSKIRTTDGNIVVTSCQVLMSGGKLRVRGARLGFSAAGKGPGLKPIECEVRFFAGLKPACGRQVQLPLLKQRAPTENQT